MTQSSSERTPQRARRARAALVLALAPCAACAPLVDVAGAFFPAWMFCILVGVTATVLLRQLFARMRLEASLGPLLLVYPSLAAAISLALWVIVYRRGP
jgi:YtcA-like protein